VCAARPARAVPGYPCEPRLALPASEHTLAHFRRRRRALTVLLAGSVATGLLAGPALALPRDLDFGEEIDDYAEYHPQQRCTTREQPGVAAFRDLVMDAYPGTRDGGVVRACHLGGRSEHKEGRGWDWMVDAKDPKQRRAAQEVLDWLLATDEHGNDHAMARRTGLMYMIFNGRIWSAETPYSWRPYRGPDPHTDHVHFSFSRPGAKLETSFFDQLVERARAEAVAEDEDTRPGPPVGPLRTVRLEDWVTELLVERLDLRV
jgi:hypothetical protein